MLNVADDSQDDGELTSLGKVMANLPVDIHVAKMIALGHAFGVLRSAIIMGASISNKSMFNNPLNEKVAAYNAKLRWSNGSWSDCITYLQAYQTWLVEKASRSFNSKVEEKRWAYRHFIQLKVIYDIHALVADLTARLEHSGIVVPMGRDKDDDMGGKGDLEQAIVLNVVIAGAFYPNFFVNYARKDDTVASDGGLANVKALNGHDPLTSVYMTGWPQKINGKLYARRIQQTLTELDVTNSPHQIKVSFDNSSKIYVTFPKASHIDRVRWSEEARPNSRAASPPPFTRH